MNEISRQVERLEKEYNFWTKMYFPRIFIGGKTSEQVKQIELNLQIYREKYGEELQTALGSDFFVDGMHTRNSNEPLRNYFFPMQYKDEYAGIILPFTQTKKVIFDSKIKKNNPARNLFQNMGFKIKEVIYFFHDYAQLCDVVSSDEESFELTLAGKDVI
jgi:hypothetical protein